VKKPAARRPPRSRFNMEFSAEIRDRLDAHCATLGLTPRRVVERCVREYLDGTSDKTLLYRQYASIRRDNTRLLRSLQAVSQFVSEFVQHWLHNTQPLPPPDVQARKRQAMAAYQRLVAATAAAMTGGRGAFFDELPRDLFALEPEPPAGIDAAASSAGPRPEAVVPIAKA
jgi:hypothetical protein